MKKPAHGLALIVPLMVASIVFPGLAVAQAQDILPAAITFATSTGYWEDNGGAATASGSPSTEKPASRHGYYKLFAVRQADRTSKVYLQQIAVADDGLQVLSTIELRELDEIKPYVTDIRPENPDGFIKEPGLFATVVLKTDPDGETERWRVAMDDLGEISVEKPSD
ncbi:hypothetical protein EV561_101221 [Rhizobium sp. BK376]|nr:hypothetical protein EV561_101221 [Rhizobium sp. BK376]